MGAAESQEETDGEIGAVIYPW